jgi:4-diphosphocytidyl-2-C-methyl-D-erythritol kinase
MRIRWIGPALVIDAPAKLNLHLSVLGRRPNGYHELETVMASIGLYDTLSFEPQAGPVELICEGADGLPADESNLVLRAASLIASEHRVDRGARIRLTKRIPMQAGLGGGSSNAAAALAGLNQLWALRLRSEELHRLAAQLGSDVNFFIDSAPLALCRGRGELVDQRPLKGPLWFVLAKPAIGLSTAAVFRHLDLGRCGHGESTLLLDACQRGDAGQVGSLVANDLERPSRELSSELGALLDRLSSASLYGSRMTGSGSACYGIAASRLHAERAARQLRREGRGDVFVVRTAV